VTKRPAADDGRARTEGRGGRAIEETPLASVLGALRRASERGELSPIELEWSVARLTGNVRRGNPGLEGIDRRDSILRASAEVFRRRGYHRATIEEIAAELFLTKAGIYHYFTSKQEILEQLCDRAMASAEAAVDRAIDAETQPDKRLERMLAEYALALTEEPALNVLMRHLDEVGEASLADLQRRRKVIEAKLRQTLDAGIADGVFETSDSRVAVFGMLGTMNWTYAWYEPHGRLSAAEVRDILVRLALNGVLARPTRARRA
jgi:TetR/AcrR family transcriptional regulator, cholesterol catabolism regulator